MQREVFSILIYPWKQIPETGGGVEIRIMISHDKHEKKKKKHKA